MPSENPQAVLEVCISADNIPLMESNIKTAVSAGAKRIELCADMTNDGLTPSTQALQLARRACGQRARLLVMVRPRAGDFCYSVAETASMAEYLSLAKEFGADGVVLGVLTSQSNIDLQCLKILVEIASKYSLPTTFHRAFDCIDDWQTAVNQLIDCGVDKVLTSGTRWESGLSAEKGIEKLGKLTQQVGNHLEVVIGGGISVSNAKGIWQQLYASSSRISLHAYSGVLNGDRVCAQRVKEIISGA